MTVRANAQRAQGRITERNVVCGVGSIILNDSTHLRGLVCWIVDDASVSLQADGNYKVFSSKKILQFNFYDTSLHKTRDFFSLGSEDPVNNAPANLIFELLRHYPDFSVLSRIDPLTMKRHILKNPYNPGNKGGVVLRQAETIYLMDSEGTLTAYLQISRSANNRKITARSNYSSEVLDRKIIAKLLGSNEEQTMQYARQHHLHVDRPGDLLQILDYAQTIL